MPQLKSEKGLRTERSGQILARYYGFTEEEVDFIINYDIKYRMGRDGREKDAGVNDGKDHLQQRGANLANAWGVV